MKTSTNYRQKVEFSIKINDFLQYKMYKTLFASHELRLFACLFATTLNAINYSILLFSMDASDCIHFVQFFVIN